MLKLDLRKKEEARNGDLIMHSRRGITHVWISKSDNKSLSIKLQKRLKSYFFWQNNEEIWEREY